MLRDPAMLHALLDHLTEGLINYAGYQIESGAQVCVHCGMCAVRVRLIGIVVLGLRLVVLGVV